MIAARHFILPGICRGGGPAKLVEGFFAALHEDPSTIQSSLNGPPPHEIVGRM